jgi:mRNA interferase MazF
MKQCEIWQINLSPTIGAEIKKKRPAVIINDDCIGILPLRIIAPITDWKPHYSGAIWMVKNIPDEWNKLKKPSAIDCFQIRSVSTKHFIKKIGIIHQETMTNIKVAVKAVIDAD